MFYLAGLLYCYDVDKSLSKTKRLIPSYRSLPTRFIGVFVRGSQRHIRIFGDHEQTLTVGSTIVYNSNGVSVSHWSSRRSQAFAGYQCADL